MPASPGGANQTDPLQNVPSQTSHGNTGRTTPSMRAPIVVEGALTHYGWLGNSHVVARVYLKRSTKAASPENG